MIISASRRTDIPALYPEWFMNRLRAGEVLVPNPYNRKKVSRIQLSPETVDCIVFWTKNPEPMLPYLKEIRELGYSYYFQMTITDYEQDLEPGVPDTANSIATFRLMTEMLGKHRMEWRFDPILLSDKYNIEYHAEQFEMMCEWLSPATDRCTISFIDNYRDRRFPELEVEEMEMAAERLSKIAAKHKISLFTCAEQIDLSKYGIEHGACIDRERIQKLIGYKLDIKKDPWQRPECLCAQSIDIGMYDTCTHGCRYCYATGSLDNAKRRFDLHDSHAPILIGELRGDEVIKEKEIQSSKDYQMSLFDLPGVEE